MLRLVRSTDAPRTPRSEGWVVVPSPDPEQPDWRCEYWIPTLDLCLVATGRRPPRAEAEADGHWVFGRHLQMPLDQLREAL